MRIIEGIIKIIKWVLLDNLRRAPCSNAIIYTIIKWIFTLACIGWARDKHSHGVTVLIKKRVEKIWNWNKLKW